MGCLKSGGMLTRGRGFEDSPNLIWLLSAPACGEVCKAMETISGLISTTSKDVSKARMVGDANDIQNIINFLQERAPFSKEERLRCLSIGIIGDDSMLMLQKLWDSPS